jgi:hypothetical protein
VSQTRRATVNVWGRLGRLIVGIIAVAYALLMLFMAYMIASTS